MYWKCKWSGTTKAILKMKDKTKQIHDIMTYYKAKVIKRIWS